MCNLNQYFLYYMCEFKDTRRNVSRESGDGKKNVPIYEYSNISICPKI